MLINQSKIIISREEIKNLEPVKLKNIQVLETEEVPSQNYYPPIIAIIERLLCS
ncbi:hypothetical protein LNN31_16495 [Acetobacterium wieringae]|uniref:Uncharacterized protein n=1 Tax=Acetobacterium wieringae TaxID=52694 RepID=A0ABY6HCZ9_9FIRM|nr:hypothetical protein [Acetobacterium wieringae]UYO62369.1 hypothetical protein LNN31_16495 [Acetobacterium wieringae]VUZ22979.1 Uncharacterised protein [Acetobacterium wieringae]